MSKDLPTLPSTTDPAPQGRVYVLRIWHESGDQPTGSTWRASCREGALGERRYFASIDECIDHLYGELVRR
ncbi:hypothetical protein K7W42_03365 [Deinococcus sp. HMF7604]|uniref:hypothetical protein n=1 Tax=Deinococcus betulae TaxID=2873312 RepID=UPI001CCEBC3A|nr:hypothetical protein [Deinococcus betulae]MBZ9749898.1 hypothetical protein [Deinococcus betulae]